MGGEALREQLAAIEHERWADWQHWMHAQGLRSADGSISLPAAQVAKWERQIATPYAALSDTEKQSDRDQVDRYWHLIKAVVGQEGTGEGTMAGRLDIGLVGVPMVRARLTSLEDRLRTLGAALGRYGRHLSWCGGCRPGDAPCTCGFEAALRHAEAPTQEVGECPPER